MINEYDVASFQFDSFPQVNVIADDLLERALRSVLENAFEHDDTETPEVTLAVEEHNNNVLVSVADDGPGVPDAQKGLIFVRDEVGPLHPGLGLSLFFNYNVIRSHAGEIWVEDNEPRGVVFRIMFMKPCRRARRSRRSPSSCDYWAANVWSTGKPVASSPPAPNA